MNQTFNRKLYRLIVPLENCDFWQIFTDHHFLASLASYLPSQLDFPQPFSLTCPTPPSPPGPKRRILSISLGLDSWLFVPSYLFVYLLKVFIPVCPLQTQIHFHFWRKARGVISAESQLACTSKHDAGLFRGDKLRIQVCSRNLTLFPEQFLFWKFWIMCLKGLFCLPFIAKRCAGDEVGWKRSGKKRNDFQWYSAIFLVFFFHKVF